MSEEMKYIGEFTGRDNATWRVEISGAGAGELTFAYPEAVIIEMPETAKHEAICGRTATVTLISPGDRTYAHLYTEAAGSIGVRIYRNEALHWAGTLDTELYEEPYERAEGYEVTLTATDFGAMDRVKAQAGRAPGAQLPGDGGRGAVSLRELIQESLDAVGLGDLPIRTLTGTKADQWMQEETTLAISVQRGALVGDEGEAVSCREAVEGALAPLGLRLEQRGGAVWVYDLDSLYTAGEEVEVEWSGDRQTLGVDRVYNNIEIEWRTRVMGGRVLDGADVWTAEDAHGVKGEEPDPELAAPGGTGYTTWGQYTSYVTDEVDDTYLSNSAVPEVGIDQTSWTLWKRQGGEFGEWEVHPLMRMVPQLQGQELTGAGGVWTEQEIRNSGRQKKLTERTYTTGGCIMRLPEIRLPGGRGLAAKVTADGLWDLRANPFSDRESASTLMDYMQRWANLILVPMVARYRLDSGEELLWENQHYIYGTETTARWGAQGRWIPLPAGADWWEYCGHSYPAYLTWHASDLYPIKSPEMPKDDISGSRAATAVNGGVQRNHRSKPIRASRLAATMKDDDEGELIALPAAAGTLTVEIYGMTRYHRAGTMPGASATEQTAHGIVRHFIKWAVVGLPTVEVIQNRRYGQDVEDDDVTYSAVLNPLAKDELRLEHRHGTAAEEVPGALGAYVATANGEQLHTLYRAGRATTAEDLLCGTLYSQYASRKTKLSGEAKLHTGGVVRYRERSQPEGTYLMLTGEREDCLAGTREMTIIEFTGDEYKSENG